LEAGVLAHIEIGFLSHPADGSGAAGLKRSGIAFAPRGVGHRGLEPKNHFCRFAQLPVGELLDRYGPKSLLMGLLIAQVILLVALATTTGWLALVIALILVTMIFAQIPITSWLLGHYVRSSFRARAASVEYVLSLGMAAVVVPLIAGLHGAGFSFDFQYFGIALSAAVVLAAAVFLPRGRAVPIAAQLQSAE